MAKRTRVTCEKCNSFLHETKDCDAEKVLGFKKKDTRGYCFDLLRANNKFVPVVSVEWLEKWRRKEFREIRIKKHRNHAEIGYVLAINNLIKAVRGEVKK